jgi:hypothetical protein
VDDTRSEILAAVAKTLGCRQRDIVDVNSYKDHTTAAAGVRFRVADKTYQYSYSTQKITEVI